MSRDSLIRKLKEDVAARRLVIIAGTGVSVAACGNQEFDGFKVASWTGLLEHGVKHCVEHGLVEANEATLLKMQIAMNSTDFLIGVAEIVSSRMRAQSPGVFLGWLKETIGRLEVNDPTVPDALAALPGVLATLNYDSLLEKSTNRRSVTWRSPDAAQDVLRGRSTHILHLHGWFEEPDSVVLGLSSYLAVRDHAHTRAVMECLAVNHTAMFVGCGETFADPNFTRLIDWGKAALTEVAPRHVVLCRTSDKASLQEKLKGAPWIQPLDYGDRFDELAPFLRGLAPTGAMPSPQPRPSVPVALDLEAYRLAMRKRYGHVKLGELDSTTYDIKPLQLTGMFIEQTVRECEEFLPRVLEFPKELQQKLREKGELTGDESDERLLDERRRRYLDQTPRPALEVVNSPEFSRVVILGDPGSGKSTLLQYLLLEWAERASGGRDDASLPLLIELGAYARSRREGQVKGFLYYLHQGENVRWHLDRDQLDESMRHGKTVVYFDGLDEVFDPAQRREIATAIHRFADEYRHARVMVTSRIIGYQHEAWRDEGFRHLMLQDLDDPRIRGFLARWSQGAYVDPAQGDKKRRSLQDAIDKTTSIRQLAGNPLLLTMMAILNRTQDLPRDRAELYEQCSKLLLHQWKLDAVVETDPEIASLGFKDKRGLLVRVARAMRTSQGGFAANLIQEETLEKALAEGLGGTPHSRPDRAARAMIEQLRKHNFMLCFLGGTSYAFVHRTFLEYFCAVDFRDRFQVEQTLGIEQLKNDVYGNWHDDVWHETLSLLAGMLAPHFVAQVLDWLLERPDPENTCRHVFLAARCVAEVRQWGDQGAVADRIRRRVEQLTDFDIPYFYGELDVEARRVREIRRQAVQLIAKVWKESKETLAWLQSRAWSDDNESVRESAVVELAREWRDDPETLTILKSRAQLDEDVDVRRNVLVELARGWRNDPETLPWLKSRAQSDEHWFVRASAVEELARGWRDDPGTLPWLQSRAWSDENESVRESAVVELVRGWRADPETLTILKFRAQSDEHWSVRGSAVLELARGWRDDPDTLTILKSRAQSDEDNIVRQNAVVALARNWRDDPETLTFLKSRAQSDEVSVVRASAVEELARNWRDDPGTLPWLQSRVRSDENWSVRRSALEELVRGWRDDPETLTILKTCARTGEHWSVRASALEKRARGWRDDPDTLPWLQSCAQSDQNGTVRQRAVMELARGWRDDPETVIILKSRAQSDEDWAVRQIAAVELARGWRDDPEIVAILRSRSKSDENIFVRQYAVVELARDWRDDPDTLPWLQSCARSDQNGTVRQSAVVELARGWRDDPETLTILKSCAQSDEDGCVRKRALVELARGWRGDPETLTILKSRAQSDEDNEVRQSALVELARGWRDDPETLTILKSRAQSDENWAVRQSAAAEVARLERGRSG